MLGAHITLTRVSCSKPTSYQILDVELRRLVLPFSRFRTGIMEGHILSRKPIIYPEFSCRSRPGCMPPGFQSRPRITRSHWAEELGIDETFLA